MPTAKKLPSGSWRCQVFSHSDMYGKRHYESFTATTKKEAEYMAVEFSLNKHKHTLSELTFSEALTSYIDNRAEILSPASIRKYKSQQKNMPQRLLNMKIKDITQDFIQALINEDAKRHSPKTLRDTHGLISAVLRHNRVNLTLNTVMPQKLRSESCIPCDNDIKCLIASVLDTDMELPVYLAAFAFMRRGEISALHSDDISGNTLHVSKTMVLSDTGQWIVKAPKSFAGDRYIQVPDFVAEKLHALSGRITSLKPNQITSKFEHVLKRAGIQHFRFHDLRHYCASISHTLGIPDAYIMQMGGWGNDRVLKDVYRHSFEDRQKEMNQIAIQHFETMQHEMQHKKIKAQ